MAKLSRIERGLSTGRGVKFKNKSEVKKFLRKWNMLGARA